VGFIKATEALPDTPARPLGGPLLEFVFSGFNELAVFTESLCCASPFCDRSLDFEGAVTNAGSRQSLNFSGSSRL